MFFPDWSKKILIGAALAALAVRSLGKTEAGREVAELMATSPVPSVEGEVPDE